LTIGHGHASSFVFAFGCRDDGLNSRSKPAIKITRFESRGNLFINDLFAERIGQRSFQSIADLQKYFVGLYENKKSRPVVFCLLTDCPGSKNPDGVTFNGRIRLHFWENRHHNLFGTLALKRFKRLVQLQRRGRGNNLGVIVEILGRRRRNHFRRERAEAAGQKQKDPILFHKSRLAGCGIAKIKLDLRGCLCPGGGGEIRLCLEPQCRRVKYGGK